jgi:hypothetical protein
MQGLISVKQIIDINNIRFTYLVAIVTLDAVSLPRSPGENEWQPC